MHRARLAVAVAAAVVTGSLGPTVAIADTQALSVTAFVADQQCLGGDFVQVTLSANAQSTSAVAFRWDFNNDGSWDTRFALDPTVQTTYPDEVTRTARVQAVNRQREVATDTVTFGTLRCEGAAGGSR